MFETILGASLLAITIELDFQHIPNLIIVSGAVVAALGVIWRQVRKLSKAATESVQAHSWLVDQWTPNGGSSLADKIDKIDGLVEKVNHIDEQTSHVSERMDKVETAVNVIRTRQVGTGHQLQEVKGIVEIQQAEKE